MKKLLTIITLAAASAYAGDYEYDFRDSSVPRIYSPDGEYLGNLNNNEFDPDDKFQNPLELEVSFDTTGQTIHSAQITCPS